MTLSIYGKYSKKLLVVVTGKPEDIIKFGAEYYDGDNFKWHISTGVTIYKASSGGAYYDERLD